MSFSSGYGSGRQQIDGNKKCRRITGDFDCHSDAAVWHGCGAHHPMEHIQGFTCSHSWMSPLDECLCCIALADAMVDKFE